MQQNFNLGVFVDAKAESQPGWIEAGISSVPRFLSEAAWSVVVIVPCVQILVISLLIPQPLGREHKTQIEHDESPKRSNQTPNSVFQPHSKSGVAGRTLDIGVLKSVAIVCSAGGFSSAAAAGGGHHVVPVPHGPVLAPIYFRSGVSYIIIDITSSPDTQRGVHFSHTTTLQRELDSGHGYHL